MFTETKTRTAVRTTGLLATFLVVLGASVAALGPAPAHAADTHIAARTTDRARGSIDTRNLQAVNRTYWTHYASQHSVPIAWGRGSLTGCHGGTVSAASTRATLVSLNYVRSLAGLAPVRFSATLNASAQQAALLMAANHALTHHPGREWRCWTPVGSRAASRSNLALSEPRLTSGKIIDLYMDDPGSNNDAVGHRRWILNPFATVMGSGSTDTANALTVVGPTRARRPNPRYVSWPTSGWFPSTMEPDGRWSLSSGRRGVSFAHARVRVYADGHAVPVRTFPVHDGYGQPTLVWQLPAGMSTATTYRVVVSGITSRRHSSPSGYSYTVRLFTPFTPGH